MEEKKLKELLIVIKYDLDDFYGKIIKNNIMDTNLLQKYYDKALKDINNELVNFKKKIGKYDKSIYIDDTILNNKLHNEIKEVVNKYKHDTAKKSKDIRAELIEKEIAEKNELDAELFLEQMMDTLNLGIAGIFDNKISYF